MSKNDLLQIKDILNDKFDNFWNYNILYKELENINSTYLVAKSDNEIWGFGGIWKSTDDIHLTNIVTRIDKRNLGIATLILTHLIKISKNEHFSSLTLEVNEKNINAIKLYEKFNFKKLGKRKNYYSQNENAIIMTLFF